MPVPKIIYNSSLPRAGSTLFQNILAQNPRFYCSATSGVIDMLLAARQIYTSNPHFKAQDANVMKAGLLGATRGLLEGWYQAITDKPVCMDKSRAWADIYGWLAEAYPKPKIVSCIRDLRAVVSSMEKLYRKNRHLADATMEHAPLMAMATVPHRVSHWFQTLPLGTATTVIINSIQIGTHKNIHFVRFEDLTTNPKATMKKVYDFLEEPPFEHDFEYVEQKTVENDMHYPIYGDHTIREQVKPVPLDYNEVLGKEVCAGIVESNPLFFQTFYPNVK